MADRALEQRIDLGGQDESGVALVVRAHVDIGAETLVGLDVTLVRTDEVAALSPQLRSAIVRLAATQNRDIELAALHPLGRIADYRLRHVATEGSEHRSRVGRADCFTDQPGRIAVSPEATDNGDQLGLGQEPVVAGIRTRRPDGIDHERQRFAGIGRIVRLVLDLADADHDRRTRVKSVH